MPSTNRRRVLAAVGAAGTAAVAGCSALTTSAADVNPGTGLSDDASAALDGVAVSLAGSTEDLPTPPEEADSLADADAVLATPGADRADLAAAFRDGKHVAFAGDGCQRALAALLRAVRADYRYGVEQVRARPVSVAAAVPRDGTAATYTFVREGGWDEPVLDPLGWVEHGRLPECDTFVPEHFKDDEYAAAGAAHVVGRLESGETYASRSVASVNRQDGEQFVRLRSTVHAAANDGYPVEEAVRETDLPDDQRVDSVFPNAHTQQGVQARNTSDSTRATFAVAFTPQSDRARGALTGCGGFQTRGALAYDHLTGFQWKRDRVLCSDRHYAEATGRGEWHLDA
ncbi:MAG: hypothetical protein ABEH83_03905 [Halobacterium sp.]